MGLYSNPAVEPLPVITEGAEPTVVQPEVLAVGSSVLFRGILCTVTVIRPDGYVEARNLTLHALALASQFSPV